MRVFKKNSTGRRRADCERTHRQVDRKVSPTRGNNFRGSSNYLQPRESRTPPRDSAHVKKEAEDIAVKEYEGGKTLLKEAKEALSCKICLELVRPPVMMCEVCRQIIGCQQCVQPIGQFRRGNSAHCPLCREKWTNERRARQIRGLEEVLKYLK